MEKYWLSSSLALLGDGQLRLDLFGIKIQGNDNGGEAPEGH